MKGGKKGGKKRREQGEEGEGGGWVMLQLSGHAANSWSEFPGKQDT